MNNIIKAGLISSCIMFSLSAQAVIQTYQDYLVDGGGSKTSGRTADLYVFTPQIANDTPQQNNGVVPAYTFYNDEIVRVSIQLDVQAILTSRDAAGTDLNGDTLDGSGNPNPYKFTETNPSKPGFPQRYYSDNILDWEYYFVPDNASYSQIAGYDFSSSYGNDIIEGAQDGGAEVLNLYSGDNTFREGIWNAYIKIEDVEFGSVQFEVLARPIPLPGTIALFGLGFIFLRRNISK